MFRYMIKSLEAAGFFVTHERTEGFEYLSLHDFGLALGWNPESGLFILFNDNGTRDVTARFKSLHGAMVYLTALRSRKGANA